MQNLKSIIFLETKYSLVLIESNLQDTIDNLSKIFNNTLIIFLYDKKIIALSNNEISLISILAISSLYYCKFANEIYFHLFIICILSEFLYRFSNNDF